MAETDYSTTARLPVQTIWNFVEDMDNWAEYMVGYQSHEKTSDTDSVWTLKGDVGVLQRIVKFNVHITEWAGPERVQFELEGLNEPMKGHGKFVMESFEDPAAVPATSTRSGIFSRMIEAVLRFFHGLVHGRATRGEGAGEGPGAGMSRLSFHLTVEPGGTMAPMVNALIKPAMKVAAEDLANKIIARLEADRDASRSQEPARQSRV